MPHSNHTNPSNDAHFNATPTGLDRTLFKKIEESYQQGESEFATSLLLPLHHSDIANFLTLCAPEIRKKAVLALKSHFTAELLLAINPGVTEEVVELLGIAESAEMLTHMDVSDAVSLLEDFSDELRTTLIAFFPPLIRQSVTDQLSYPENSAGRLMHRRMVSVMDYWTVGQAIDYLRYNRNHLQEFYELFVLNSKYQPVGAVPASRVLCSQREVPLTEIMNADFKIVQADLDQEEVSYLFTEYELTSAPVVNKDGRLVGMIALDDVVTVIEEEAEEDILRLGGVEETDIHTSFLKTAARRLPWLLLNLCTAVITCSVIRLFEGTLQEMLILAAVMPVVASLSGNAGTQSLTVAVRSIATKELSEMNAARVILKEVAAAITNGFCCAILGGLAIYFWQHQLDLSLVFSLAIILNFVIAALTGTTIPLLMLRLGVDPAIASGVFLTGVTDAIGFFTFLLLSTLLLL